MTVSPSGIEYRLRAGPSHERALVIFPGAHMSASCSFGEDDYADLGRSVLVVSRPGYGRTAGSDGPATFAARVARLARDLGLSDVTAIGISMGARTACYAAADHLDLVARLVLVCPVSFAAWPDPRSRRSARAMFNPVTGRLTWALVHAGLRHRPERFLPLALGNLSSLPPPEAVARLAGDREAVRTFLLQCRSGEGLAHDLRPVGLDPTPRIEQPSLVLATRHDAAVSLDHPERLAAAIRQARLVELEAPSHLLWWGDRRTRFADELTAFDRA